jgi:hypothetical protein
VHRPALLPARARALTLAGSAVASLAVVTWVSRAAAPADAFASRPGFAELFFSAQAGALTEGALDVPPEALPGECYVVGDACYGYYGLTPSLLRLPLLAVQAVTGEGLPGLTSLMLPLAVMVGIVAGLLLVDLVWRATVEPRSTTFAGRRSVALVAYASAAVAVGPGSLLLQDLRPRVFEEAIAWSASLGVVGLLLLLRWVTSTRLLPLLGAIAAFTLSAGARPTGGVMALAVAVAALAIVAADRTRATARQIGALVALGVLPLTGALLVFRLKFDAWLPDLTLNEQIPEQPWWADILAVNGGLTFSPTFVPTTLWAYLRPVPGPFSWLPPLEPGSLFVEATTSVTALAPLALILLGLSLLRPPRIEPDHPRWASRLLLLASLAGVVVPLAAVSVTHRYLGDAVPGLTLAIGLGSVSLAALASRVRPWAAAAIVAAAAVLAAYGVVASVTSAVAIATGTT